MIANRKYNFRIEVYPRPPGDFGVAFISGQTQTEKEWIQDCEEIASQIRRHVDGLPSEYNRGVNVIWDTSLECEYCGAKWTEIDNKYNGGCCSKDEENAPKEDVT